MPAIILVYINIVVHNGNVLLCEISCNISFSLCNLTSHLGLHNRSIGPVTGVMVDHVCLCKLCMSSVAIFV